MAKHEKNVVKPLFAKNGLVVWNGAPKVWMRERPCSLGCGRS